MIEFVHAVVLATYYWSLANAAPLLAIAFIWIVTHILMITSVRQATRDNVEHITLKLPVNPDKVT